MAGATARRANHDGSIYQRADGKWFAAVTLENGRRVTRTRSTETEAKRALKELLQLRDKRLEPTSSSITVGQFLLDWLDGKQLDVRESSINVYRVLLRRVAEHIGRKKLSALKPQDVKRAYAALLESGLAPRSLHAAHAVLKQAIADGYRSRMIEWNIMEAISAPTFEPREMRTFTADQGAAFLEHTTVSSQAVLLQLLLMTGLRVGEATALRWQDIDHTHRQLHVHNTLRRLNKTWSLGPPKTKASRRTIELSSYIVATLQQHRLEQARRRETWPPVALEWQTLVFTDAQGLPLGKATVSKEVRRVCREARVPIVRTHDLRHTCATLLIGTGMNPKVVQEMLGHSNVSITLSLYAHVMPGMHRAAADLMQQLLVDQNAARDTPSLSPLLSVSGSGVISGDETPVHAKEALGED
jgi:integrase